MNDIDDLRAALRRPPSEPFAEPDLARIMADGARIRRRRRLLNATGTVAAAAAVVLVVVFAVQLRQPPPVAQPAHPGPSLAAPGPSSTRPPSPSAEKVPDPLPPLGEVISTGLHANTGDELVIYAVPIKEPTLPKVQFGLVVGYRDASGSLTAVLETNETALPDRSFGFHATDGGEELRGGLIPVFGYFAGPATRITTTVKGATVAANQRTWTEDPGVVFFWFNPALVPSAQSLTPLVAYDAKGVRLTK